MYLAEGIKTFLLAMTPIGELRAAIPVAIAVYKIDPVFAYIISVLGNIFAVFLILIFLGVVSKWLSSRFYLFNRFFAWLFSKTRKNYSLKVQKYGSYILPLFVAIPLPVTGGWTAALVAFVFDIPFKKAFPLIAAGIMVAGIIVIFATNAGITVQKYFGWQILVGKILAITVIYLIYKKVGNNNSRKI